MRVPVATVAEFFERVSPAYLELVRDQSGAAAVLEIELAPGEYRSANFSVGDPLANDKIDVVIRASDDAQPPLLTEVSLRVAGNNIRVEHLVFTGRVDHLPIVSFTVGDTLTIDGCAWTANVVRMPPEGRLLEISAHGSSGGTDVLIRDCWFVRNQAPDGQTLLMGVTDPPFYFRRIALERVAILDNLGAVGIVPHATGELDVSECVVAHADAMEAPPVSFVAMTSPSTQVHVGGSLVVLERLVDLVTLQPTRERSPRAFDDVTVSDSQIVVRGQPEQPETNAGMRLVDVELRSFSNERKAALTATIDDCAARLNCGELPDLAIVRGAIAGAI